jgi:glutaminyl-tRNA synthetase
MGAAETGTSRDFVRAIIEEDIRAGKNDGRVHTRFPPEPNGYLHIGHAKAFNLNFSVAEEYGGLCNLRFDDTNPLAEETEYVESIKEDIRWLGYDWGDRVYFASDYFERLYEYAVQMIRDGKAYVCDLSPDEIREYRGTLTEPGRESPWRDRSVDENLELFERMRTGEFDNGQKTLRAKIDMAAPNMNMRDPVMYRIVHASHHRTGSKWCIYPTYDWTHGQCDSIEGVTHSICSIEFEDHRPLYDWYLDQLGIFHPQQIEFARLYLSGTVLSKRRLLQLVEGGQVDGWNDPRMPTLSGLRRRGYTPESIRDFLSRVGVAKTESVIDIALLEHCLREDLNRRAPRVMAVLRPLRLVIENYPEDRTEFVEAINNPEDDSAGSRALPFSREIYVESDDFREDPPPKFFRLAPGREVRLKHAYLVTCRDAVRDPAGRVVELRCTYDPDSRGGEAPDGRKVRGTLHWVSARHGVEAEVRLFDHLLLDVTEEERGRRDLTELLNPDSREVLTGSVVEASLRGATSGTTYQFLRTGYFCADSVDSTPERPVFNRAVSLRDSWAKIDRPRNASE